jgi:hypothetical protein
MQPDLREPSWSYGAVARTVSKRRRIWRKLVVGGLMAGSDPRVPADECSPNNSAAVGDPLGGNPGIIGNKNVSPFVSGHNPGVSTGALGFQSNAIGTCPNSLP